MKRFGDVSSIRIAGPPKASARCATNQTPLFFARGTAVCALCTVSERAKACKDAKATKETKNPNKQTHKQNQTKQSQQTAKKKTPHPKEAFAASETSET